jgi:selenocysteine lyase/cysteine desulfurase
MRALGIDLLAVAGHKGMMGIQGSGALLFSERVNPSPLLFGGTGSISVSLEMPDFYPDELEAGTISYPAVLSLLEGVRYLTAHKRRIFTRLGLLTKRLWMGLQALPAYQLFSKPHPCGIVSFAHKDLPSEELASVLSNEYDIAVRGGLHCAPLMHEALGSLDGGLVRASLSHFNNDSEIDELLNALREIAKR